jgi:hypothetical protein
MKKSVHLIIASLSLAVTGAAFSSSQVSAATGIITSEISVDCVADNGADLNLWNYESEIISVSFTNCDAYSWFDKAMNPKSGSLVSPFEITTGDQLLLFDTGSGATVQIETSFLYPARVPPGELQYTENITIGVNPKVFSAGPEDNGDGEHRLGGKTLCELDADPSDRHVYTTLDITIVKAGRYTFRSIGSDPMGGYLDSAFHPIADPFLALYSTFDPKNPDEGILGCNDDLNDKFGYGNDNIAEVLSDGTWMEGHHPYFAADLEPGEYTLLLTTWRAVSKQAWTTGVIDGRTWTPGEATLTFELWGPRASLCVGHDPACDPVDPTESTLPPTGSSQSAPFAVIAMLLTAAGVLVIKIRRAA